MTQEGRPRKPRHRRRATAADGPPQPPPAAPEPVVAAAPPQAAPPKTAPKSAPKTAPAKRRRETGAERGLRDVVGAGSSQVGVSRALRARDVNRPSATDLAEAEAELQIVRRNWKPQS